MDVAEHSEGAQSWAVPLRTEAECRGKISTRSMETTPFAGDLGLGDFFFFFKAQLKVETKKVAVECLNS